MSLQFLGPAGLIGGLYLVARHYRYGYWGGPQWSGGEVIPEGSAVNRNAPARDALDEIFRRHDIAYEDIRTAYVTGAITESQRNALINEADRDLVGAFVALDFESVDEQYRTEARLYGAAAANLFSAKIALYEAGTAIQDPSLVLGRLLLQFPLLLTPALVVLGTGTDPDGDGVADTPTFRVAFDVLGEFQRAAAS